MTIDIFAKVLSDSWVSILIATAVVCWIIPPVPELVEPRSARRLAGSLERFAEVPAERLNTELIMAAGAVQRGWYRFFSSLVMALVLVVSIFASDFLRAVYPDFPWWCALGTGVVAGLMMFLARLPQRLIRRAQQCEILRRLEPLLHEHAEA